MVNQDTNRKAIYDFIKARAYSLGFCLCGLTSAAPLKYFNRYQNWVLNNNNGEMDYLASERHLFMRQDPTRLVPWVKTIAVFALPYPVNRSKSTDPVGQIAGYVGSVDYHILISQKLAQLNSDLSEFSDIVIQTKAFCDSSPVLERELAVRAGLGWIGRNSCFISPEFGSALLLSELFLDIDLPVDSPFTQNHCGTCNKCLAACPTKCILEDRSIDARQCISTLTIENKSFMPFNESDKIGNHLFGCDVCQSVCPWNHKVMESEKALSQMSETEMIEMLTLSDSHFKTRYQGTAFLRAKRRGLVRNICAVLANQNSTEARDGLQKVLESDADPICRISAAIAIKTLVPLGFDSLISFALQMESDPLVIDILNQLLNKIPLQ